jgi:subtilisin family serine protease
VATPPAVAVPALELVRLLPVMARTSGIPEITIGLIDGPVDTSHPDLADGRIRGIGAGDGDVTRGAALRHGTFVAGILVARRGSIAPSICPGCTLLVRPIFGPTAADTGGSMPRSTPVELARAILDCVDRGARVVNISAAIARPGISTDRVLAGAIDHAAARGVIVVAAAGNDASLGGTNLTSHPWVIPVIACDRQGRPALYSNLGHSIGRRGLAAPGDRITSLGAAGPSLTLSGTSAAAPFVTGALALVWSEHPHASAATVRSAVTLNHAGRRGAVVPPLLDAWAALQAAGR